jgi:hypothetical protein
METKQKKDYPVLVLRDAGQNNKFGDRLGHFECFNFETNRMETYPESVFKPELNAEHIETIKQFHESNIKRLEDIEKCLVSLEVSEVSQEEYIIWNALEIMEKDGTTKSQKSKALLNAFKAI